MVKIIFIFDNGFVGSIEIFFVNVDVIMENDVYEIFGGC